MKINELHEKIALKYHFIHLEDKQSFKQRGVTSSVSADKSNHLKLTEISRIRGGIHMLKVSGSLSVIFGF